MVSSYYDEEINRLQEAREKELRIKANNKTAEQLRELYNSFVTAGFTEEQAWTMFMTIIKNNI